VPDHLVDPQPGGRGGVGGVEANSHLGEHLHLGRLHRGSESINTPSRSKITVGLVGRTMAAHRTAFRLNVDTPRRVGGPRRV
jgi:hypothetical protein